jgi:hypothetical protein
MGRRSDWPCGNACALLRTRRARPPGARVGRRAVCTTLGSSAARLRRAPRTLPRGSGIDDPRGGRVCNVLHRVSAQEGASRYRCPPRRRGRLHLEVRGAMDAQNGRGSLQCLEGISALSACERPTTLRPCLLRAVAAGSICRSTPARAPLERRPSDLACDRRNWATRTARLRGIPHDGDLWHGRRRDNRAGARRPGLGRTYGSGPQAEDGEHHHASAPRPI